MQLVAVLLAAAAGFGAGAVWYMINGKRWMAAVGRTEADMKADKSPLPFVIGIAASVLTAGLMRHVFAGAGVSGIGGGLVGGLGVGLFFVAPWIMTNCAFAGRPKTLWWIDSGHVVLACSAIGLVLGLFL
ncbi:MAG TPA: DUF1761 domain-containing protein [Thermohalobaculum sp.]|nr:DUF1761 domain-containing protein [Thermohalobaculum sp.]